MSRFIVGSSKPCNRQLRGRFSKLPFPSTSFPQQPQGWAGLVRRSGHGMSQTPLFPPGIGPAIFVIVHSGGSALVAAASMLFLFAELKCQLPTYLRDGRQVEVNNVGTCARPLGCGNGSGIMPEDLA
ncbi:hypothetical protein LX36DRAFT_392696 [Colletotrichum falcatum]|nr:hypothetical protein LX36DRAFT_392696 [Colletotrichum falcatum]